MRLIVAIIFLGLYGLALVKPALPILEYYVKLAEYKQNCSNKARPELHCDGKCILMQKLKALNTERETPLAPPVPAKVNFDDFPISFIEVSSPYSAQSSNDNTHIRRVLVFNSIEPFASDIFHPPLAMA